MTDSFFPVYGIRGHWEVAMAIAPKINTFKMLKCISYVSVIMSTILCLPGLRLGPKIKENRTVEQKNTLLPEISPHKVHVVQALTWLWFSPKYNTKSDSSPTYISNSQGMNMIQFLCSDRYTGWIPTLKNEPGSWCQPLIQLLELLSLTHVFLWFQQWPFCFINERCKQTVTILW